MPNATPHSPRTGPPEAWRLGDGAPPTGSFVTLVPGTDAPLLALVLPATLKGPAREEVARRQVRDRLGAGFDLRPLGGEGWTRAAVALRSAVLRWRGSLGTAAPRCRAILPDYLMLPAAPGLWSVASDRDGIAARLGPGDGFSAEPGLGLRMLAQALAEARTAGTMPRAVLRIGADAAADALFDGVPLAHAAAELPQGMVPLVLGHGELSADFARDPRADAAGIEARLRRALWPAVLVLLGALGWAAAQGLATRQDRARAVAVAAETLAAVRRDLLPDGPILDLRVQVTREIDRRRAALAPVAAPGDPLDLLRIAAPVLAGGAQVNRIALVANGLRADVLIGDFRALDALVAALAQSGIDARVDGSGIEEGSVAATLLLQAVP